MLKTSYHILLKGYVGGWALNRTDVDKTLAENEGKPVNVFFDSLGSFLATCLSNPATFKKHGNVSVSFVGHDASVTTFA